MTNAADNLVREPIGKGGREFNLPVDGGSHLFEGIMVAQLVATAMLVPGSTAASGPCIGVSMHEVDNTGADASKRCAVESDRIFIFANGTSTDACSEATPLGAKVYMLDDHTVADNDNGGTLMRGGYFMGMEPDGRVRVLIVPLSAVFETPAADVGALTLTALAGTANTTLEALADLTDAPQDADTLREDIVTNLLPKLRNNLADLGTQINAIRTALRAAGLML